MPRQPRVHFPGAIFHVIARGNNQQPVFSQDDDRRRYLNRLEYYQQKYPFEIFAYVLMNNHVHLIIQVQDFPLAKIMQGLQQSYTLYYNHKYDCSGHVFQQRYKALLCQKDDYLLTLIKYIHLNPVRAGITESLDYAWSSHNYYTGVKKGKLINTEFVYSMLSSCESNSVKDYLDFMGGKIANSKTIENVKTKNTTETFEELLASKAEEYGIDMGSIMQKRNDGYARSAKIEVIKALIIKHNWQQIQVAEAFGINRSTISKILKSR